MLFLQMRNTLCINGIFKTSKRKLCLFSVCVCVCVIIKVRKKENVAELCFSATDTQNTLQSYYGCDWLGPSDCPS